jgi:hypothetical protein
MSPNEAFQNEWDEMLDGLKKDHENQISGGKKYWSPPSKEEGTFPIRILPPLKKKGEKVFYFQHTIHWIDGTPYECTNQELVDSSGTLHEAEECPICAMSKKLYKISERDSDEWKLAGELRAQPRYVYRVIARDPNNPEEEVKPKFYETGKKIFEILFHILTETDYGIIVHPKEGRDFNIVKKGKGRRSNYDQSLPAAKITPIFSDTEKLEVVIKNALEMDYNALIDFVSAKELEKKLKSYLTGETEISENNDTKVLKNKKESVVVEEESVSPDEVEDEDEIDELLNSF